MRKMHRSQKAARLWRKVYPKLTDESVTGLLAAATARAEAQVLRLSMLYCLLDGKEEILTQHLRAALEVWRYAADSARYIFGDALGDPLADRILSALAAAPDGLTRTEIRGLFNRHAKSNQITRALESLARANRAEMSVEKTSGRPIERWKLVAA